MCIRDRFYNNLKQIQNQNKKRKILRTNIKDHLIGSTYNSKKSLAKNILTYEKAVNKFSLLTDQEFENLYLMKPEALTFDKSYIQKRKDPKYSYEYFKKLMNKWESSINDFDSINYPYECTYLYFLIKRY